MAEDFASDSFEPRREVCRDYMRNVCSKGDSCKYLHPPKDYREILNTNSVCHDFQNPGGCDRIDCKFLHLTKAEEKHIRETNSAPPHFTPDQMSMLEGLPPICNDWYQGRCTHGSKCKFRHIGTPKTAGGARRTGDSVGGSRYKREMSPRYEPYRDTRRDYYSERVEMRLQYNQDIMEDEIRYLRSQVERLRHQMRELVESNDLLMEQNIRLRSRLAESSAYPPVSSARTFSSSMASIESPAVRTMYTTTTRREPPQSMSTLSHQLAVNSELAQKVALQQRIAHEQNSAPATNSLLPAPRAYPPLDAANYM